MTISILSIGLVFNSNAQQFKPNTEIGLLLGGSYYLGDLNTTHFNQPLAAAGLIVRRNIDKRLTYKAEIMYLNLESDERENKDTLALSRGLHFRSSVYEVSGQLEFNFFRYQPGNPLYSWTPFIYTGVSLFYFNPQAENTNGTWVDLQELGTEGQGTTTFPDRNKYSLVQFAIPIGGGVKIALNESFNIILEYGARKTFTDYIDDVSTTFVGGNGTPYPLEMSLEAQQMSDPLGTHSKDIQRGNPDKNDWYAFLGITLSFKLNNNTKGCYP
jgi:hypothetical protein